MMPKVYVTKAEKDLKLMEIEKRNGKLKLTIDSDEDNLSALHCSQSPQTLSNQKTSRRQRPKPRARSRPVSSSVLDWVQSDHNQNEQFSVSSSPPETIDSMPTRSNSPRKKQRTLKGTIGPKPTSVRNDHLLWKTYESSNHGRCNNLESGDLDSFGFTNIRDFSADFGIHHLRMGCKISGQLDHPAHQLSILEIAINGAQSIPVVSKVLDSHEIWGITFSFENTQSCEEWTNGLRDLIDRIQDEVMVLLSLESQSRTTGHRQSLNEIWSFLKRVMDHVLYQATKGEFVQLLMIWVKDLLNRLDDLVVDMINRVEFSQLMMFLTWGSFELVYRINIVRSRVLNQQISPDNVEVSHELGQEVLRCLIRRLLEYGPAITMSRLKSLMDSGDSNEVHDISIEIWSLLINLVLNQSLAPVASLKFLEQSNFWETLVQVARLHTRRIELPLVGRGEALSFLSMMICAISQFDSKGVVSFSDSRIDSCWSILVDSLGSLPETVFGEGYDSRSRVRRDQYIRSIFSRVLILNQRWGWKIEFDNGVVERMYKILNGNKLERLLIEANEPKRFGEVDSFPDVLKDLSKVKFSFGQGVTGFDCALKKSDTSFGIFLKALIQAQNDLAKPLSQQREKEFEKIISRCNPLRQLTFKPVGKFGTRIDRKITIQSRSSLINHSSLFLIYSILFPKTLKRQLSYLNNLYRFNNLDSIARKTHMKIWNKVSRVLKIQSESSILPVVEKIKESLKILIEEYSKLKQLEKNVRAQLKPSNLTRKEFVNGQNRANQAQTEVKEELDEIMEGVSSSIELVAGSLALAKEVIETWGRDEYLGHWLYPSEVWIDLVTWIAESDENLMKENLIALEMDRMINSLLKVRIKNVDQHREEQSRIEELSSLLSKNGSRFAEQQDSIEMDEDENRVLELEELK
ncbi:Mus7/MMS22 family-domain-containing protein, partial [Phakopsora pachyrhizi]